jgi:hypothetical protein
MPGLDGAAFAQDGGALDHVAQLPHVARPVMRHQHVARVARDAGGPAPDGATEVLDEGVEQRGDVVPPLAQRRQRDTKCKLIYLDSSLPILPLLFHGFFLPRYLPLILFSYKLSY